MQFPFEFKKEVVLRSPQCAFALDEGQSDEDVMAFFRQPFAREALYIASPDLVEEFDRVESETEPDPEKTKGLIQSLSKYYNRMRTRCTPFGLFSTISTVEWGEASQIELEEKMGRFTRFDMHYLCSLANFSENLPGVKAHLKYFPNSSLYQYSDTYRFVEFYYDNKGSRSHQISEVDFSEFLEALFDFAKPGKTIEELANFIVDEEISYEDAEGFIYELIEGQLVLSELEFTVTGDNYIQGFVEVLEKVTRQSNDEKSLHILNIIKSALQRLTTIDLNVENSLPVYEELIDELLTIEGIPIDKKRLFQVDSVRAVKGGTLDGKIRGGIKHALFALTKLSSRFEHGPMDKFKEAFLKRYGDREMPMMQILDSENGIGYGSTLVHDDSVLTRDVVLPPSGDFKLEHTWDNAEQWKTVRLHKALTAGERIVEFTDEELQGFANKEEDILKLPASISVLFSITKDDQIRLEHAGNPSALNLLGRFAHCDPRIENMLLDVTAQEQERNNNVILAEIAHLPEDRIGNIVQRPTLRPYEIPYLAKSSVPTDNQIRLDDLMVSIRWNRVFLRSRRLNKEVVPRLGNAHNFSQKAQPVYQFLAELQFQDVIPYVPFSWNKMDYMYPYLPGARYKGTILSPSKWFFRRTELEFLKQKDKEKRDKLFQEFKATHHLPDLFVLADGDNELFINSNDPDSLSMFFGIIKKRDMFQLVEFFEPKNIVTNEKGETYNHQFVASLVKTAQTYQYPFPADIGLGDDVPVQTDFSIGDDWLYYLLYTGIKTSDRVLKECIAPLVQNLQSNDLISDWFFIRYNDPEDHLRVRFKVKNKQHGEVIRFVQHFIAPFQSSGQIWKVAADTYTREINRYGKSTIHLSEQIFGLDSREVLEAGNIIAEYGMDEYYNWIVGIMSTDLLFDCLGFDDIGRSDLMEKLKENFAQEFRVTKPTKKVLSQKFRTYAPKVEEVFNAPDTHPFKEMMSRKKEQLEPICQEILQIKENGHLYVDFENFVMSHIHMIFNRLVPTNQRKHEMVIYDLLFKHYKKQIALNKKRVLTTTES